jgi:hypothetical protein
MKPYLPISLGLALASSCLWGLADLFWGTLSGLLLGLTLFVAGASGITGICETVLRERGRLLAYVAAAYGIIVPIYMFAIHLATGIHY